MLTAIVHFLFGVNMYIYLLIMLTIFNIVSLNVNGLRNQVKRRQIFDSCSSENIDILLLQETHASGYKEAREWGREFGGEGLVFRDCLQCRSSHFVFKTPFVETH